MKHLFLETQLLDALSLNALTLSNTLEISRDDQIGRLYYFE